MTQPMVEEPSTLEHVGLADLDWLPDAVCQFLVDFVNDCGQPATHIVVSPNCQHLLCTPHAEYNRANLAGVIFARCGRCATNWYLAKLVTIRPV